MKDEKYPYEKARPFVKFEPVKGTGIHEQKHDQGKDKTENEFEEVHVNDAL